MDSKYISEINKKLSSEEKIFKLNSALYDGQSVKITLIAEYKKYDLYLNNALKAKLDEITKELIPSDLPFEINFRKSEATEKNVLRTLFDFLKERLITLVDSFSSSDLKVDISETVISISVPLPEHIYMFCISSNIGKKIEEHLERFYIQEVKVNFLRTKSAPVAEFKSQHIEYKSPKARLAKVLDVTNLLGYGKINQPPSYIIDIDSPKDNAVICGKLKNFSERKAKSNGSTYFSFMLNDTTGSIAGVAFPKKEEEIAALNTLKDDDCVVLEGRINPDKYTQGFQIVTNRFGRCAIDFSSINVSEDFKEEPLNYVRVFPEKIEAVKEKTLLGDVIEEEITPFLKNKTFVVFDLETTDLNWATEKIIEISAIKVVDGVMTETFSTLINPERQVSENTTALTHIDNEMLKDAPVFKEVIGDFYKFTRNAVLVGHNIDNFDIPFLRYHAKIEGYNFNNDSLDTLFLSRQYVRAEAYKLESLCEMFSIPLIGAHRAINDAKANALLFIELVKLKDKKSL